MKDFKYSSYMTFVLLSLKYLTYRALNTTIVHHLNFTWTGFNNPPTLTCFADTGAFTECLNFQPISMAQFTSDLDDYFTRNPGRNLYPMGARMPGHIVTVVFSRQFRNSNRVAYLIDSDGPVDPFNTEMQSVVYVLGSLFDLVTLNNTVGRPNRASVAGNIGSISPRGYCLTWTLFYMDVIIRHDPAELTVDFLNQQANMQACSRRSAGSLALCNRCCHEIRRTIEAYLEEFTRDMFLIFGIRWTADWGTERTVEVLRRWACTTAPW